MRSVTNKWLLGDLYDPSYLSRDGVSSNDAIVLQDPSVASSPVEKRVAFLQSKNLTQEEVDLALSRAGEDPAAAAAAVAASPAPSSQQVAYRPPPQAPQGYGGYPPYNQWQPPPEYVPHVMEIHLVFY